MKIIQNNRKKNETKEPVASEKVTVEPALDVIIVGGILQAAVVPEKQNKE